MSGTYGDVFRTILNTIDLSKLRPSSAFELLQTNGSLSMMRYNSRDYADQYYFTNNTVYDTQHHYSWMTAYGAPNGAVNVSTGVSGSTGSNITNTTYAGNSITFYT